MIRKIRMNFAFPFAVSFETLVKKDAALGHDRVSVDDHKRMVNFVAMLVKVDKRVRRASKVSDKHKNRRSIKRRPKSRKEAHKRGPCFLSKNRMACKTKNNLHIPILIGKAL